MKVAFAILLLVLVLVPLVVKLAERRPTSLRSLYEADVRAAAARAATLGPAPIVTEADVRHGRAGRRLHARRARAALLHEGVARGRALRGLPSLRRRCGDDARARRRPRPGRRRVGFVSGDRYQSDGKTYGLLPWSTPLGEFRDFGAARLPGYGEARWREPTGEWTYGQFWLERIVYNERSWER